MAALVEAQDHAEDEMIKSLRDAISKCDFVNDEADESFDALSFDILSRYLKARKGNVAEAKTMLEETLKWRKAFGVGNIHTKGYMKVIEKETFTGKTYVGGYCRDGHALLYMRPRRENSSEYDGNLKHVVYNLERCVESMKHANVPTSEGKLKLIIDFAGYSTLNSPPMKTSRDTLSIIQNQYPERLFKAYIVRAPWIFSAFWTMISPFIDPVTYRKIQFVKGSPEEIGNFLSSAEGGNIDPAVLECDLGGSNRLKFDGQIYAGLKSEVPAQLEAGAKLPFETEKGKTSLPQFKSSCIDSSLPDSAVLESCKTAFSGTYAECVEAARAGKSKNGVSPTKTTEDDDGDDEGK